MGPHYVIGTNQTKGVNFQHALTANVKEDSCEHITWR